MTAHKFGSPGIAPLEICKRKSPGVKLSGARLLFLGSPIAKSLFSGSAAFEGGLAAPYLRIGKYPFSAPACDQYKQKPVRGLYFDNKGKMNNKGKVSKADCTNRHVSYRHPFPVHLTVSQCTNHNLSATHHVRVPPADRRIQRRIRPSHIPRPLAQGD